MDILKFITDTLSDPPIIIGLFAFVGLILSRQHFTKVIDGTLKAALGFVLLAAGADIIGKSLNVITDMFIAAFNIEGVIPLNEAVISLALVKFGGMVSIVMVLAMIINLLVARFTRWKYIFLTGHHTLYMSALVVTVFMSMGVSEPMTMVFASLITGLTMTLNPAILQKYTKKITGSNDIALGHFGGLGYFTSAQVGKLFKKGAKSVEDIEMPKSLNFLRDSTIQISLSMIIMITILTLFVPGAEMQKILDDEGMNILVFIIEKSLVFTGGVYIVLQGVKMTISELVPAFKGISDKLIPGAIPALDCPVVFPYSANAVLVGFIASFFGGVFMMFLLPVFNLVIIIPVVMTHFFTGATAGVYGNSTGGYKGAIAGAFANGMLVTILPAIFYPILGSLGFVGTTFADVDMALTGIIVFLFITLIKS